MSGTKLLMHFVTYFNLLFRLLKASVMKPFEKKPEDSIQRQSMPD